jgi:hypothetical protein
MPAQKTSGRRDTAIIRFLLICMAAFSLTGCHWTLTGGVRIPAGEANPNVFDPLLGQKTTLQGVMNFSSHIGPRLNTEQGPVYLISRGSTPSDLKSQELEGKSASVTGVLQFHAWTTKNPHNYYYFDADTAQVKTQ